MQLHNNRAIWQRKAGACSFGLWASLRQGSGSAEVPLSQSGSGWTLSWGELRLRTLSNGLKMPLPVPCTHVHIHDARASHPTCLWLARSSSLTLCHHSGTPCLDTRRCTNRHLDLGSGGRDARPVETGERDRQLRGAVAQQWQAACGVGCPVLCGPGLPWLSCASPTRWTAGTLSSRERCMAATFGWKLHTISTNHLGWSTSGWNCNVYMRPARWEGT